MPRSDHDDSTDDDRASRGVEHLQVAATEVIAAARVFLDLAEDLVRDPDRLADVVETLSDLARGVGRAMTTDAAGHEAPSPGVEHIRVG